MKMIDYSIKEEKSGGVFRVWLSSRRPKLFTSCKKCWQFSFKLTVPHFLPKSPA
jgi:hypothetical protein